MGPTGLSGNMEISEESFMVTQISHGSGFHWGCCSWIVRSEYVFWKLEPIGTNGLDRLGEEKEREGVKDNY